MNRPGKRWLRLVAMLALAPPALWLAVLLLLPMGWARDRVVDSLRRSTHQVIRLDTVRLRPWGGLDLRGLEIASPATPDDPWLKVAVASVDGGFGELVRGRVKPTACRVSGVSLRVHRDARGNLEFAQCLRPDARSLTGPAPQATAPVDDPAFNLSIDDARVTVADDPSNTRLELAEIRCRATIQRAVIVVTDLGGTLNGGTFAGSATIDRGAGRSMAAEIRARDVNLGVGMNSLAYVIPLLATDGKVGHARGMLAIEVHLEASGDSSAELARTLTGRGDLALDALTLDDSRILDEVQAMLPVPTRGKLGALRGHFAIADRRVSTTDTVLKVAEIPIDLSGWSDFDGRLDYLVRCEKLGKAVTKLASRLPVEARDFLADLQIDDLASLADVRVYGTIDHPKAKSVGVAPAPKNTAQIVPKSAVANPKPTGANPKAPAKKRGLRESDKAKLREAANRFLERAIR